MFTNCHLFDAKTAHVNDDARQRTCKCSITWSICNSVPQIHISLWRADFWYQKVASYSRVWTALAGGWYFQIHRTHSSQCQTGILTDSDFLLIYIFMCERSSSPFVLNDSLVVLTAPCLMSYCIFHRLWNQNRWSLLWDSASLRASVLCCASSSAFVLLDRISDGKNRKKK